MKTAREKQISYIGFLVEQAGHSPVEVTEHMTMLEAKDETGGAGYVAAQ